MKRYGQCVVLLCVMMGVCPSTPQADILPPPSAVYMTPVPNMSGKRLFLSFHFLASLLEKKRALPYMRSLEETVTIDLYPTMARVSSTLRWKVGKKPPSAMRLALPASLYSISRMSPYLQMRVSFGGKTIQPTLTALNPALKPQLMSQLKKKLQTERNVPTIGLIGARTRKMAPKKKSLLQALGVDAKPHPLGRWASRFLSSRQHGTLRWWEWRVPLQPNTSQTMKLSYTQLFHRSDYWDRRKGSDWAHLMHLLPVPHMRWNAKKTSARLIVRLHGVKVANRFHHWDRHLRPRIQDDHRLEWLFSSSYLKVPDKLVQVGGWRRAKVPILSLRWPMMHEASGQTNWSEPAERASYFKKDVSLYTDVLDRLVRFGFLLRERGRFRKKKRAYLAFQESYLVGQWLKLIPFLKKLSSQKRDIDARELSRQVLARIAGTLREEPKGKEFIGPALPKERVLRCVSRLMPGGMTVQQASVVAGRSSMEKMAQRLLSVRTWGSFGWTKMNRLACQGALGKRSLWWLWTLLIGVALLLFWLVLRKRSAT